METVETAELGREKNIITITIISDGVPKTFEHNIHHKIRRVVDEAIKAFGIQPPPNTTYILTYDSLNLDDMDKSLKDYGIPDRATLTLVPRRVGAG